MNADSDEWELQFAGPWLLLYGGTDLQTALEIRGLETNCAVRVQHRFSKTDPSQPDAFLSADYGATCTADGEFEDTFDVSAKTQLWVQVCVFAKLTTGTAPKTAFVRLWSSVLGAGWIIGRARVELGANQNNTVLIGSPFAAADVSGVKLGVSFIGVVSGIKDPDVAYRTFTTGNATSPGTWTTSGNTVDAAAGNSKENYVVSTTTANKMLIQAGFAFSTSASQSGFAEIIAVAKK